MEYKCFIGFDIDFEIGVIFGVKKFVRRFSDFKGYFFDEEVYNEFFKEDLVVYEVYVIE